jgi:hypothetical protein
MACRRGEAAEPETSGKTMHYVTGGLIALAVIKMAPGLNPFVTMIVIAIICIVLGGSDDATTS